MKMIGLFFLMLIFSSCASDGYRSQGIENSDGSVTFPAPSRSQQQDELMEMHRANLNRSSNVF